MERNIAGQIIELFAFNTVTGVPATGDAANLTAYVSKDGGTTTALADTSAAEISSTNAAGWYRWSVAQLETDAKELLFTAKSSTSGVVVIGKPVTATPQNYSVADLDDLGTGGGGTSQPRANKAAGRAYQIEVSSMADGTYKCTRPIRLRPGVVAGDGIAVDISMKPQFGEIFVQTVGTPTVSGGSLTCEASGPRDQAAQVIIDGTATASESRTITVPVTMETDEVVSVTFDVKVFAD